MTFANSLAPIAVGAVVVVLLLGMINMVRGGSANTSQYLMRWRVGLQFLAIIVILALVAQWAGSDALDARRADRRPGALAARR